MTTHPTRTGGIPGTGFEDHVAHNPPTRHDTGRTAQPRAQSSRAWRHRIAVTVLTAALLLVAPDSALERPANAGPAGTPRIILDTDFGQWFDDVAALAAAHTAADRGHAHLLGVVTNVTNPHNAAAIDAINTYYGRPDLPVGVPATAPTTPDGYSRTLTEHFPHHGRPADALTLYRQLLTNSPDHSVTIVAIGALTNLARLQQTDRNLITRKITRVVIMGGQYPHASTPEWNFTLDLHATQRVVTGWPTPIAFTGYEVGAQVFTGSQICTTHPARSPVRAVFKQLYGCGTTTRDGSWDPTALLYALYETRSGMHPTGTGGHNTISRDGRNHWQPGARRQHYLHLTGPARTARQIDALLNHQPRP